jgi:hypothetical protein
MNFDTQRNGYNSGDTSAASNLDQTYTADIGSTGNGVLPLVGDACEILVFNSVVSTDNQQLVEGYLAWKWGLEANLPSGHPYENAAPTAGITRRRIGGGLINNGLINRGLAR